MVLVAKKPPQYPGNVLLQIMSVTKIRIPGLKEQVEQKT